MQAPLLAYNHFVETVYSLNDCREGIAAGVRASQQAEQPASLPADGAAADVRGSSLAARAKRDTIYRCVALAEITLFESRLQLCDVPMAIMPLTKRGLLLILAIC